MYLADHNEISHTSRQWHCRNVWKIRLWSGEHNLNQSTENFDRISNFIEIYNSFDGLKIIKHGVGGVHIEKYARFFVFCCNYVAVDLSIFFRIISVALGQF